MKRSRLRPISPKRAKQVRLYARLRAAHLKVHHRCQVCRAMASRDIHHIAGRNGDRLNRIEDWLAVCRECHDYIHKNPTVARYRGWLR